jgi:hypothetical protein
MAMSIFAIHLLGDLWSPPLVGGLADVLHSRPLGMMLLPLALLGSGLIWWVRGEQNSRRRAEAGTWGEV